jgi:hypothetical protein
VATNGVNSVDTIWAGVRLQNLPSATTVPKTIALSTITANQNVGFSCATGTATLLAPAPTSVLVSANTGGVDITNACGFVSCGTASGTCGVQP